MACAPCAKRRQELQAKIKREKMILESQKLTATRKKRIEERNEKIKARARRIAARNERIKRRNLLKQQKAKNDL